MNKKANDPVALGLLDALCTSATSAFETMVFKAAKADKPFLRTGTLPPGSISGTISLTGDNVMGSVSLIFNQDIIEKLFRSMMMMGDTDPVDMGELKDAVGELTNMVAGGAKSQLQGKGIEFNIGLPTVVVGENHYLELPHDATSYIVPMTTDAGAFNMISSIM